MSSSAVFSFAELASGITCIRQLANNTFSRQGIYFFFSASRMFYIPFSFGRFLAITIISLCNPASSVHLVYLYDQFFALY